MLFYYVMFLIGYEVYIFIYNEDCLNINLKVSGKKILNKIDKFKYFLFYIIYIYYRICIVNMMKKFFESIWKGWGGKCFK